MPRPRMSVIAVLRASFVFDERHPRVLLPLEARMSDFPGLGGSRDAGMSARKSLCFRQKAWMTRRLGAWRWGKVSG